MNIFKHKWLWISAFLLALVGGTVLVVRARDPLADYPDAPFARVGADFPRIIPVAEAPSRSQSVAWAQYVKERQARYRYLTSEGAISRASPREREAVQAIEDGKYIKARELAQAVLKTNRDSIPARYALAAAQYYGENCLPWALHLVRQVRQVLEERGRTNPNDADAREWYLRTLDLEFLIVQALDRPEEVLRIVDLLAQVYQEMPWRRVWPLMKLGRFDEAEACIRQTEATGRWPREVLNDRCALASERRQRRAAFAAGRAMVQANPDRPVLWSNFAEAAMGVFQLEEAERALRESARLADQGKLDFAGTPYRPLALLHLQGGRFSQAWTCLLQAKRQRDGRQPYTLELDQGSADRAIAAVLLALGYDVEATRFARRAHDRPNRTGSTTNDASRDALTNKVLLWTVLQSRIQQLREAEAGWSGVAGLLPDAERKAMELEAWTLQRQIVKLLTDELSRRNPFRIYLPGNADMESWLVGSLIQILPPGVATVAIREARSQEKHEGATAYLDAFEAEAALARGDAEEALALAHQALAKLPVRGEKLLRARTAAIGGEAARRLGKTGQSMTLFDQALGNFPEVFRLLDIALPVRVQHDGSPLARLLAARLLASPRFQESAAGFPVILARHGKSLSFTVLRRDGKRVCKDSVALGGEDDAVVANCLNLLHRKVLTARLQLTKVDINSLDSEASGSQVQDQINRELKKTRPR